MANNPDQLRDFRGKATVAFTLFTRQYEKNKLALFCFFEGKDDSKYYSVRIDLIVKPIDDNYFPCGKKSEVLRTHSLITEQEYYNHAKTAYFIDKDFDESIYKTLDADNASKIYETPCYSIENFYTSSYCFKRILRSEFTIDEIDDNFDTCLDLYENRQNEFHEKVGLLNAYIACLMKKDEQEKLDLKSKHNKLMKWFIIELDKIKSNYNLETLNNEFSPKNNPSQQDINKELNYLRSQDCQKSFRGKFEIEFLRKFLEKLKEEANKKKDQQIYFSKKLTVSLLLSNDNILSQLSQYADTPDCLVKYLEQFKENVNTNQ
ncbi:hypothetical protein cce_2015 [Crocosphaera subtropica ATCC 51142]|uniref:DUF4435 domain-containing protein n=1 Tax=Crocosphaera subtropica (strain ATCC 51142 / BH68) TaxID=43989 RepID=B1X1D6_CROS5|nr:DUF4435 domain-containing protein [Crocosphaera subtropica]ACB51365.1 hypothetical protein cce_2015 [Crocosphaera subtropica ATCC 51142]